MKKCAILFLVTALSAVAANEPVKFSRLEKSVLWVRIRSVPEDFAAQFHASQPTNPVSGLVLDLRFADGTNAVVKDDFLGNKMPLVILVGRQTRETALAWAEQLRAARAGIVIGSSNFVGTLQPDVTVSVSDTEEKTFWENPYFQAVTNTATTNSLLSLVDHTSEAELVRKRVKDGEEDGPFTPTPRAPLTQPIIRDPALARAVDLLKALALLPPSKG